MKLGCDFGRLPQGKLGCRSSICRTGADWSAKKQANSATLTGHPSGKTFRRCWDISLGRNLAYNPLHEAPLQFCAASHAPEVAASEQEVLYGRFVGTKLVFCAYSAGGELTCDESNLCGRYLCWSGHQPNRHSVSAIHCASWASVVLLLLFWGCWPLLRRVADGSWLGLYTQSAHGRWRTLSCHANG